MFSKAEHGKKPVVEMLQCANTAQLGSPRFHGGSSVQVIDRRRVRDSHRSSGECRDVLNLETLKTAALTSCIN
jgi:hypothetical protein